MAQFPLFLFDIGATQTRIGISLDGTNLDNTQIYPTPQQFDEGLKELISRAKELSSGNIAMSVGGIAGPLNKEKTMITNAPNLPDWNGKPFSEEFIKGLGTKVFLENDTALAGLGEAINGAGKGKNIVAYMTVSTGVNGVLIVDKKIAPNAMGFEIGNQIVDLDKSYDRDAFDFEDLVSGSNFQRRFGKPAHEMADPNVWAEEAHLVSVGLTNLIVFWSPEIVVLGGAVSKSIPLDKLLENLGNNLTIYPELPFVKRAELGEFGGLWGALAWGKSLS